MAKSTEVDSLGYDADLGYEDEAPKDEIDELIYRGESLDEFLRFHGRSRSLSTKRRLAVEEGVEDFDNSKEKNRELLTALRGH